MRRRTAWWGHVVADLGNTGGFQGDFSDLRNFKNQNYQNWWLKMV
jgi:hypothetical protein